MQREKLKKRKAEEKRQRRQDRKTGNLTVNPETDDVANHDQRAEEVIDCNDSATKSNDETGKTVGK